MLAALPARAWSDYDRMHLRVDRILTDRSPYRVARPPAQRELHEQVDQVLRANRAPKKRASTRKRAGSAKRKTSKKRA
jgi:hypothetical protein